MLPFTTPLFWVQGLTVMCTSGADLTLNGCCDANRNSETLCLLHTWKAESVGQGLSALAWLEMVPVLLHPTENIGSTGFLLDQWREMEPSVLCPLEMEFRAPGPSFGFKFLLSHLLSVSRESLTKSF